MLLSTSETKDVRRRIGHARRFAEKTYWPSLDLARKLYKGEQWPDQGTPSGADRVVVNYLYPTAETKVSGVAQQYPDFYLVPLASRLQGQEALIRELLRYTFRTGGQFREAKRALRDMEIGGLGFAFSGWRLVEENRPGKPARIYEGARPDLVGEMDPTENAGDALPPIAPQGVRENRPFGIRIPPRDFWVAPESTSVLQDAMYCGYSERVPLDKVKRNPRYKNTRDLKGTTDSLVDLDDELRDMREEQVPSDCRRVLLHHYLELDRRVHVVFAEEEEKPLLVEAWPWPFERYPIRVLRVPDDEDCFYPVPPLVRLEHAQREINHGRTILALHQRQSNRKYQRVGKLSEANKRQLRHSGVLGIVELEDQNMIQEVPHAPIQTEIFQSIQAAQQDIQVFAALSEYETFTPPTKRTTQMEVEAIKSAGGARSSDARAAFEEFLSGIAQDQLALLQQYSVGTSEFPIFSAGGQFDRFGHYTKEEIAGDYLIEVYANSTTAPNRKGLQEATAWLAQSLPNFMNAIVTGQQMGMNLKHLLQQFLLSMNEIRDVETIFQPDPNAGPAMLAPGPGVDGAPVPAEPAAGPPAIDPAELEAFFASLGNVNGTSGGPLG